MTSPSRTPGGVVLIVGSLLTWAVVLAIGAFAFGYRSDLRKPLVIVGVMLCFLAGWLTLLIMRQRRLSAEAQLGTTSDASEKAASDRVVADDAASDGDVVEQSETSERFGG